MENTQYHHTRTEKGQALVIIVLALILILGFGALAVDMGSVYLSRRDAQSAADSAALSAASALCSDQNVRNAALKLAAMNGFVDNSRSAEDVLIEVNNPPSAGQYAGDGEYIEVVITTTSQPVFSGFVFHGPLTNTVRAISRCAIGAGSGSSIPGLGGGVAILALNPTANNSFMNTGTGRVLVGGGVFINSTSNDAFNQTGSSVLEMTWARIRGGAKVSGSFGIYGSGGAPAQVIEVVKDFRTSGAGMAISGAFNIGGNVVNSASVNMTGNPMNVGGNFDNSGAGNVKALQLLIGGNIINSGSGNFTSEMMRVGGNITASGASWFKPEDGKFLNMSVKGNINLTGSAVIGSGPANSTVYYEGTYTHSGTGRIDGNSSQHSVTKPEYTVSIPQMADPLADVLTPPTPPTGSCASVSIPSWGSHTINMTSGGYYCNLSISGSASAVLPPGTYWVNSFSMSGATTLVMDGVQLYVKTGGFSVSGSAQITSMQGTMIYIKQGAFSFSGASGAQLNWTAPGEGQPYRGLALYMDRANASNASLSGSATIRQMSGTWYAPAATCSFTGASTNYVYSQFICDKVAVTGSGTLKIKYDSTLVYQIETPGGASSVSLIE